MSPNSTFLVDEYQMATSSPFSVEEYCVGAPSPRSPQTMELSHEFSIDEYHYTKDSTNKGNDNHVGTSVAVGGQIDITRLEAISASVEEINSASLMHFRRVPHRNSRHRFAIVTSEKKLKIDVGKKCCTRGCMSMIGKDKL